MTYTDEWAGYKPLKAAGRGHAAVNHGAGGWARDDDGDRVREGHCATREGRGTGLRDFPRPLRGVNQVYLEQSIKMFEWACNLQAATDDFLRTRMGRPRSTRSGT